MKIRNWIIGGAVVAVLFLYFFVSYNSLVKKQESANLGWANLQSYYQRRLDLIPGLVSVVKGSSDYEKKVLTELATARAKAAQLSVQGELNFSNYQQLEEAQGELANAANNALSVVENYPDIKSTKNFHYLQTQLEGTERRIKIARMDFNLAVATYNKKVRNFPTSIPASIFGFRLKEGFTTDASAANAPEIKI